MHTNTDADLCVSHTDEGEVMRGYVNCVTEGQSWVRRRQERLGVHVVLPLAHNGGVQVQ